MTPEEKNTDRILEENAALKRSVEEMSVLSEFAGAVAGTMDVKKIMDSVIRRSLITFNATHGVMTLVDEQRSDPAQTLIRIAVTSAENKEFHFNEGLLGWMLLNKKPLLLNDPRTDPRFDRIRWDEAISSLLCAPMMVKGALTGVLTIYTSNGRYFTADDQRLLSIIAIQMAQVVEYARLEEEKRTMQNAIARDLHDDVASSLSSIALYAENLKRLLGTVPDEAMRIIDKMSLLSQGAVDSMGDIVWSIAPEHDVLNDLLVRMKHLAVDLCTAKDIRLTMDIPDHITERVLPADVRRNIYLIFKETLNNIISHSNARNVHLRIHQNNTMFELTVSDDGVGVTNDLKMGNRKREGGHGLRNMERRAKEINAQLSIASDQNGGTVMSLLRKMT